MVWICPTHAGNDTNNQKFGYPGEWPTKDRRVELRGYRWDQKKCTEKSAEELSKWRNRIYPVHPNMAIYLGQDFDGDDKILKTRCDHYCLISARAFWLGFGLSSLKGWSIWFVVVGPSAATNWRVLFLFACTESHFKFGICRWTDTP